MKIQEFIIVVAYAFASSVNAASLDDPATYGQFSPSTPGARIINVNPETHFVSVRNGETITFTKGSESFTWHVDTYSNISRFNLSKIAPKDFHTRDIDVYVGSDVLYTE